MFVVLAKKLLLLIKGLALARRNVCTGMKPFIIYMGFMGVSGK
jgi:hypothetical protein